MKSKKADYAGLKKAQASAIVTSVAKVDFKDQIVLAGKTDPITGVVYFIKKTKNGNFRYAMTSDEGTFQFMSTTELDQEVLHKDIIFGEQVLPDGTKLLWYNSWTTTTGMREEQ